ncbi:hypothetical protein CWC20_18110 [Pseudoalteromonas aurantia]|uniref:Uncharacterized protein n=1 Tax=Pseudoalteromonas aurantia TaxID=43654 RepID=A0ABY2VTF8_9GAMM|nr:hypothetical protein CWC20_18110 [Pseudoalteromonas aurantia]
MFLVLDLRQEDNGGKYGSNDNNNDKHGVLDPDLRQENNEVSVIKKPPLDTNLSLTEFISGSVVFITLLE